MRIQIHKKKSNNLSIRYLQSDKKIIAKCRNFSDKIPIFVGN